MISTSKREDRRKQGHLAGGAKPLRVACQTWGLFFLLRNAKKIQTISMDPWSKSRMVSSSRPSPRNRSRLRKKATLFCTVPNARRYNAASRRARRSEPPEAVNDLVLLSQGYQACWVLHPVVCCFPITVRSDHLPYHRPSKGEID